MDSSTKDLTSSERVDSAVMSRAEPSRAEPSRAEPSRAEPSRAEPSRAEPSRAEPSRAELCPDGRAMERLSGCRAGQPPNPSPAASVRSRHSETSHPYRPADGASTGAGRGRNHTYDGGTG